MLPKQTHIVWRLAQMTTTLRPLMGPFSGWDFAPREFFLHAWFNK
jgi:hypothetical protein